ncbi:MULTISPECIES: hypothetical protein [unclassified Aureispira]|uniref:hypothetical protein n=1 Tax=unclassified Aureispira TaxID=2649989 RepID=UPI000698C6A1|nr:MULTISPECIES: hypothetical protein [unclassified Aureispira]WMX12807.1 hypothetical protein QP953_18390 [Aureispira sp. CCB-E]
MKKDIPIKKVTDIAIAIVPSEEDENFWDVYFLNLKEKDIKNVFISSRGYGEIDGEKVETTQLRYFYELIGAEMAVKIEPIDSKLFRLANEYWISFNFDGFMYDKKYIFVPGSLIEENFTNIPIVNKKGVMIK